MAPRLVYSATVKKWNLLVSADDGKRFYQNFHIIAETAESASQWLVENYPYPKLKPTAKVEEVEEMEDATHFLPGIVYKSGKAYFNR